MAGVSVMAGPGSKGSRAWRSNPAGYAPAMGGIFVRSVMLLTSPKFLWRLTRRLGAEATSSALFATRSTRREE